MNVFDLHDRIVSDYASYIRSFINIADPAISKKVHSALSEGKLWPDPLLQFNPAYEQAGSVEDIVQTGMLHHAMPDIFKGYTLYRHQLEAIRRSRWTRPKTRRRPTRRGPLQRGGHPPPRRIHSRQ